jgi:NitT/TauT family transport system substrate-binding protein
MPLNRRKVLWSTLALMLAAILVASLNYFTNSQRTAQLKLPTLRIGYLPIAAQLPLFVAVEEGYFRDEDLQVQLNQFTSSNDLGNAATADRIDVMAGTASNVVFDIATVSGKRHKLFVVNPYSNITGHFTDHMIVRKGSDITKLSQLRGRRIASFPGSVNRIFVNLILEKYGVPRGTYEYVEMPPPNWEPALQSGSVDAVSALEPAATQIIRDGVGTSIFAGFYADLMPDVPLSGHWIAADYLNRADPKDVAAILRAYVRAVRFIREHEDRARLYLVRYANVRADIVNDVNLNPWRTLAEINITRLQEYADLLAENGALQKLVDVRDFVLPEPQSSATGLRR